MPWTCTGDIVTAVAMLTVKYLGGAALYHELETVDYATGEVVIANSGEHDLAWLAPGERPRLRRNGWFCDKDPRCGVCAVFEPEPGPATLVGFTPSPSAGGGFRYVAARGELTSRRFPATGTVNAAFRFASGPVEEAWTRWVMAGVNHHSAATVGDVAAEVAAVARHLGVEAVVI
jgi:L-arabinose isomerase